MKYVALIVSCLLLTGCVTNLGEHKPYPNTPFLRMEQVRVSITPFPHTLYSYRLKVGDKVGVIEFQDEGKGYIPRTLAPGVEPFFRFEVPADADIADLVNKLTIAANEYVSLHGQEYWTGKSNHFAEYLLNAVPELKAYGWRLSKIALGKGD